VTGRRLTALAAVVALVAALGSNAIGAVGSGHGTMGPPDPAFVGVTKYIKKPTKTSGCKLGANPDRRCSPGAYYTKLTKDVICPTAHTEKYRWVADSVKRAVEIEYGMDPTKKYGTTLEIDHIVSLELGGSNDIANLYPEKADAHPGYHAKDKLEHKLHKLVCDGVRDLNVVQVQIAKDWQTLYKDVYHVAPTG
jgi:hypothetical protein